MLERDVTNETEVKALRTDEIPNRLGALVRVGESHDEVLLPEQIVRAVEGLVQKAALSGQLNKDTGPMCMAARDTLYHEIACFILRRERLAVTAGQEQAIEVFARNMRAGLQKSEG